jgi:glycosyltransferase involved in cell wall biosynthesis
MITPKVSVLIPCYNGERYLGEAIDSCLAQTYPNVEVVVVNDGSQDNSAEIARSYGDLVVYIEQANRGLSGARNTAIQAATGEFVILCDSDDVLLPNCIELRVRPMIEDPSIALVAGYYREIDADGNLSPRIPEVRRLKPEDHFWQELRRNYGPPVGWTIRKAALHKSGLFDPLLPHCEDVDLCLRLLKKNRMAYVSEVTAHYRQHGGGQSKRHLEYYAGLVQVLKKNSCYTKSPLRYWWCSQLCRSETASRILYAVLTTGAPTDRLSSIARYCAARPEFLIYGVHSMFCFVFGKRPSSASRG